MRDFCEIILSFAENYIYMKKVIIGILKAFPAIASCALAALSAVSCTKGSTRPSEEQFQEYLSRMEDISEGMVDMLDYFFQVNMYLEAEDSAARADVLTKYFNSDPGSIRQEGDTVYFNKFAVDYTVNTYGRTLNESGAVWEISYVWWKPWSLGPGEIFELTLVRRNDGYYSVEGVFGANRLWEPLLAYSRANLDFRTDMVPVPWYDAGGSYGGERPTVSYDFSGSMESYFGENQIPDETMPVFGMSIDGLSGYNPKEYIGNSPIFDGSNYFSEGEIMCRVAQQGMVPGYMSVHVKIWGEWSVEDWKEELPD